MSHSNRQQYDELANQKHGKRTIVNPKSRDGNLLTAIRREKNLNAVSPETLPPPAALVTKEEEQFYEEKPQAELLLWHYKIGH